LGPAKKMKTNILTLPCACLLGLPAFAQDFVLMKNGDRITGDVKQIWNGEVFIEPEYGDPYAIDIDYVSYIQTAEPFEVDVRIGRRIETVTARLGQSDSGDAAVLDEAGRVLYPLAMVDNIEEIEDYYDWSIRGDLSINVSQGNTETASTYLSTYADFKRGEHYHELTLVRDEQSTSGDLTKDQSQITYQNTWTFTDDWFVRGTASWTSDPIRDLDSRVRIFLGPGYHIFDDSKRTLNVSLGPEFVTERIGEDKDESVAIKITTDYEQKFLRDDLDVYQSNDYTRIYRGRQNNLFETEIGFRYDITDDIYLSVSGTYDYESNPAEDQKKEDISYLIGLGVKID